MPPKAKLHKASGKSTKALNTPLPSTSAPNLSPEVEQQFEIELCWCIQQLQRALESGKLSEKQTQENTKVLNTLMSNSAPLIKKRQLMRLTFGDYRAKMNEEDKKLSKATTSIKISQAPPSKKSVFLRKATWTASDNSFRFNFDVNKDDLAEDLSKIAIKPPGDHEPKTAPFKKFLYNASGNNFKFNFNVDEENS